MANFFENATLGFCWWDIPALIALIAVTAWFVVTKRKLNKEKEELEGQLSKQYEMRKGDWRPPVRGRWFLVMIWESGFTEFREKREHNEIQACIYRLDSFYIYIGKMHTAIWNRHFYTFHEVCQCGRYSDADDKRRCISFFCICFGYFSLYDVRNSGSDCHGTEKFGFKVKDFAGEDQPGDCHRDTWHRNIAGLQSNARIIVHCRGEADFHGQDSGNDRDGNGCHVDDVDV